MFHTDIRNNERKKEGKKERKKERSFDHSVLNSDSIRITHLYRLIPVC
jgi:hypothetical protein